MKSLNKLSQFSAFHFIFTVSEGKKTPHILTGFLKQGLNKHSKIVQRSSCLCTLHMFEWKNKLLCRNQCYYAHNKKKKKKLG